MHFSPLPIALALTMVAAGSLYAADSTPPAQPAAATAATAPAAPVVFATVDGVTIDAAEYDTTLRNAARQKFYHGTPPESQVEELKRDVGNKLIDQILLRRAAKERGVGPDTAMVDAEIAKYEARYKDSPRWKEQRESILPGLRGKLEQDSVLEVLEKKIRTLPPATENEVRGYYKANPDKFTEPEKIQLGIILLTVDPSSTTEVWKLAMEEGGRIHEKLKNGADFAELAKLHSSDESASNGGEMEYIHKGMTPDALQDKIDTMKVGEYSEPVRILEGIAIFKLLNRKAPIHHSFERVRERATDLYDRDRAEKAWTDFKAGLRKKAKVEINTQRYPIFAEAAPNKAQTGVSK